MTSTRTLHSRHVLLLVTVLAAWTTATTMTTTAPATTLVMAAGSVSPTLSSALFYQRWSNPNFFTDAAGNLYWTPLQVFMYDPTGVLVRCIDTGAGSPSAITPSGDFIVQTSRIPQYILRVNSEGQALTNISKPYSVSSLATDDAFVYVAPYNRTASDLFILKYALSTGALVMNVTTTESVNHLKTDSLGNMYYLNTSPSPGTNYTVHKMFANGTLDTQFSVLNILAFNRRYGTSWFDVDGSDQSLYRWQYNTMAVIERVSLVDGSVIRAISVPWSISSSYQSITTARDGSGDVFLSYPDGYARFNRDGVLIGGFGHSSWTRWGGSSVQIDSNDRLVFVDQRTVSITANMSSDVVIATPFTLAGSNGPTFLRFVLDESNRGYFLSYSRNYTLGNYDFFLTTSPSLQAGANLSTFALWSTVPGDLITPISMAVDASGQNVFFADPSNSRIVRIEMNAPSNVLVFASGVPDLRAITLSWREPSLLFAVANTYLIRFRVSDGALLSNITLPGAAMLYDVVVDPSGNAYLADRSAGVVFYVDASTSAVSVFASSSAPARFGPKGIQPVTLALTADGACLVVRDFATSLVRLYTYGSPTRCGTTPIAVLAWGDVPVSPSSSSSSSSSSSVIAIAVAVPCGVILALVVLAIAVKRRRMQKRRERDGAHEHSSARQDEDPDMLITEMNSAGRRGRSRL